MHFCLSFIFQRIIIWKQRKVASSSKNSGNSCSCCDCCFILFSCLNINSTTHNHGESSIKSFDRNKDYWSLRWRSVCRLQGKVSSNLSWLEQNVNHGRSNNQSSIFTISTCWWWRMSEARSSILINWFRVHLDHWDRLHHIHQHLPHLPHPLSMSFSTRASNKLFRKIS